MNLVLVAALLLAGVAAKDPIDRLVVNLSADPLWENGAMPMISLPPNAPIRDVVAEVLSKTSFPVAPGKAVNYTIVETRQVRLPGSGPGIYTAVLLKTDRRGLQIVLLQPAGGGHWSSRIYGANEPGVNWEPPKH